jgi:hypothetical protein
MFQYFKIISAILQGKLKSEQPDVSCSLALPRRLFQPVLPNPFFEELQRLQWVFPEVCLEEQQQILLTILRDFDLFLYVPWIHRVE